MLNHWGLCFCRNISRASSIQSLKRQGSSVTSRQSSGSTTERSGLLASATDTRSSSSHKSKRNAQQQKQESAVAYGATAASPPPVATKPSQRSKRKQEFRVDCAEAEASVELPLRQPVINSDRSAMLQELARGVSPPQKRHNSTSEDV